MQCASGDPQWRKTHNLLVEYIVHSGGPERLLENDRAALLGNSILEDHLVYLTVYDTFGEWWVSSSVRGFQLMASCPDDQHGAAHARAGARALDRGRDVRAAGPARRLWLQPEDPAVSGPGMSPHSAHPFVSGPAALLEWKLTAAGHTARAPAAGNEWDQPERG